MICEYFAGPANDKLANARAAALSRVVRRV
jgi:hypothetical protein